MRLTAKERLRIYISEFGLVLQFDSKAVSNYGRKGYCREPIGSQIPVLNCFSIQGQKLTDEQLLQFFTSPLLVNNYKSRP